MTTTTPTIEERLSRLEGAYDHLATKADIARIEGELKADIAELKGSFKTLIVAMTAGLALLNILLRFWPS